MAETVFILCALTSLFSAIALYRGYLKSGNKLLLWSALCFSCLAMNNIFLCLDLIVFPTVDMHGPLFRNFLSATAGSTLLYGLIMEVS